jgi:hypothetical protein
MDMQTDIDMDTDMDTDTRVKSVIYGPPGFERSKVTKSYVLW